MCNVISGCLKKNKDCQKFYSYLIKIPSVWTFPAERGQFSKF